MDALANALTGQLYEGESEVNKQDYDSSFDFVKALSNSYNSVITGTTFDVSRELNQTTFVVASDRLVY